MSTLQEIATAQLPAFRANIRHLTRKEWAANVRRLFKDLLARHTEIDSLNVFPWTGYGPNGCEWCKVRHQSLQNVEAIILAAFPDLDDRGNHVEDYLDDCLSIQ